MELGHAVAGDELLHGAPVEAVTCLDMVFRRAFIPQVAAIEREAKPVGFAPEQHAHRAVAERDGFIPGLNRSGQFGIQRAVRQISGDREERQDEGRCQKGGETNSFHLRACLKNPYWVAQAASLYYQATCRTERVRRRGTILAPVSSRHLRPFR